MKKPIALQLYSLRQLAEQNFEQVLKTAARIGYQAVEFADFHNKAAAELADILKNLNLRPIGAHVAPPTEDTIESIASDAATMGYTNLLTGFNPEDTANKQGLTDAIKKLKTGAALAKSKGLQLCLHNHWWEFEQICDGKTVFDIIMQQVPDLKIELDIYWCVKAGSDPVEILKKYNNRIELMHVKDGDLNDDMIHTALGDGEIKLNEILNAANTSKINWLIVEIDDCETDIVEAVEKSYNWLIKNGFAIDK